MEKVNPIILRNDDGTEYKLEFTKATVKMAERGGFTLKMIADGKLVTGYSELFYYAFMANHRYMKQTDTDRILEEVGGMSDELAERLIDLYTEPAKAFSADDEARKNSKWSVKL